MDTDLKNMIRELTRDGRFAQQRRLYQHGTTTVLRHCVNVAAVSLLLAGALRLSVNKRALLRGARSTTTFCTIGTPPARPRGSTV